MIVAMVTVREFPSQDFWEWIKALQAGGVKISTEQALELHTKRQVKVSTDDGLTKATTMYKIIKM